MRPRLNTADRGKWQFQRLGMKEPPHCAMLLPHSTLTPQCVLVIHAWWSKLLFFSYRCTIFFCCIRWSIVHSYSYSCLPKGLQLVSPLRVEVRNHLYPNGTALCHISTTATVSAAHHPCLYPSCRSHRLANLLALWVLCQHNVGSISMAAGACRRESGYHSRQNFVCM